jgi:mono/diheme cytochrome c family protein
MFAFTFLLACGGDGDSSKSSSAKSSKDAQSEAAPVEANPKGIGEVKNVDLDEEIKVSMVFEGKQIYEMKCASCHKLTDKRVVGPGFQGVTNRRTPEWIMNMITNVDVMLEEDPVARKLLEECLTRMPNQGLSVGDARDVLEFLRQNDESRIGKRDRAAQ